MTKLQPMNLESKDLVAERIEQMKELFPEIVTEGTGSVDFDKLRLILGDNVDEGDERYAFTWPGKADAIRQAQTLSTATLRPAPDELIVHIISMYPDKDALIVDFFSGSATTAHAILELHKRDNGTRNFVLVQLPEPCEEGSEAAQAGYSTICEIGKERIRRAGQKIADEIRESNQQLRIGEEPKPIPDIGFRVLKLDESCLIEPEPMELLDSVVKDCSDRDIIFEMMLKWGLELTLPIEEIECVGYPCYSVAADELVCCMVDGLTIEALEAIADLEPRRVLLRDSILTDTLKLNAELIFARVKERTQIDVDLRTV